MTTRRNLNSVPLSRPVRTVPDLRAAIDTAVDQMDWLEPSDMALVDVARALADQIEHAVVLVEEYPSLVADVAATGDDALLKRVRSFEKRADMQKVVGWFSPLLQGVLRDLGGSPVARKLMQEDAPVGERLAALRSMTQQAKTNRMPS